MNKYILTPFSLDQAEPGLQQLEKPGWVVNKPTLPAGTPEARMAVIHAGIKKFATDTIAQAERPVSIAGDCCTTIGMLAGLQEAGLQPTLIWLDAHGDLNTPETTPSGFIGGMPLAMIVGWGDQTMVKAAGLTNLAPRKVVLSDGRNLDPGEKKAVDESHLKQVTDVRALMEAIPSAGPLYVHFDVDVVNPEYVPAVGYSAPGGPSPDEMALVMQALAETHRICAASMTAWDTEMDTDGGSRDVCLRLLEILVSVDVAD